MKGADYIIKRTAFAIMTVFVAITLNFVLFRAIPGDAVTNLSRVPHASQALKNELTKEFGLDKSKWQQYVIYLKNLAHLNLGISFSDQQPVLAKLRTALANTIPMVFAGTLFSIIFGIATGVIAAWRRGTPTEYVTVITGLGFYSMPSQWLGIMLILLFGSLLPTSGMRNYFQLGDVTFLANLKDIMVHMILPATTLGLVLYGEYTLVVRSAMLETLGEDYILTARAKGLPDRRIVRNYALRNALLPIVTLIALSLGYIVAGTLLVETVFSWPGIGLATYDAVSARDYPMLQGAFLVLTLSVVFFNFLADLLYFKLDPRITE